MMNRSPLMVAPLLAFVLLAWDEAPSVEAQSTKAKNGKDATVRQEEQEDYYTKWLNEDGVYLITDEEKEIFKSLTTAEEKEQFIEQFWARRDSDPKTPVNEFKEEHYRRIAYAKDHFSSGLPGWRTDRGRVYIIYGPPDEIQRHPSGGGYNRPIHEGGGATAAYPFEIWFYRNLAGIGSGVELEFVDKTWNEDYRLALSPDEKDVFLNVPGQGMTLAEQLGLATKFQRSQVRMNPGVRELYPMMHHRVQDSISARYETFAKVKAPPPIKYQDLKEIVKVNLSYQSLPFKVRQDYFRLNEQQLLVPITLEFENRHLTFQEQAGIHAAKIGVYGMVSDLTNRLVSEFDDDLVTSFRPEHLEKGLQGRTIYQKILVFEGGRRYKLTLVAKDLAGGNIGTMQSGVVAPSYQAQGLSASSLIVADFIQQLPEAPEMEQMFVLGDVKVRPSLSGAFPRNGTLGIYLQLYNTAIDQNTLAPAVRTTYRILKEGKPVLEVIDEKGSSLHFFSDRRLVLIKGVPLQGLEAGQYQLEVEIEDRIRNEKIVVQEDFRVVAG